MKLRSVILLVAAIAVLAVAADSMGNTTPPTWYLDQSNTFADGVLYGEVSIVADASVGTVQFTVDAYNVQPTYGALSNFGIHTFGFNYTSAVTSTPDMWSLSLPTGWNQDNDGGVLDGFGFFLVAEAGTGATRQDPLMFTITLPTASEAVAENFATLSTGTADQGHVFFAAHVAGFATEPTSHWIGGSRVVPAPGATLLGIIGLAVVSRVRRRLA